jgi:hypothetical protein
MPAARPLGGEHREPYRSNGAPIVCPLPGGDAAGENRRGTSAGLSARWGPEAASVTRLLQPLGEPTPPPRVAPVRGPPEGAAPCDPSPAFDPSAAGPAPAFEFDPTLSG